MALVLAVPASASLVIRYETASGAREALPGGQEFLEHVDVPGGDPVPDWPQTMAAALASESDEPILSSPGVAALPKSGPFPAAGDSKLGPLPGRGRFLLWTGFSAAACVEAFRQSQASWGASKGRFHFKADFKGDGLAMTDEVSHLLVAYRLSRVIEGGYRWSGMDARQARLWGSTEAWFLTFLVEYPIDAYNPQQGFGVSDLIFNTIGAAAAYAHSAIANPRWDIKVSVKPRFFNGDGRIVAYNDRQYDDFVYWITYRPIQNRYVPLLFGAGYSTTHATAREPIKELRLGVGTTLEELGALIGPRTERFLRPLNFFFFNLAAKVSWR
ncbi:MAG: DUF2279 domain-containing protein [candidate division Zixibacteria bacterium]|nr:DUF2279 domain-containing protein [candidate division Zixibacteria bacterium]